MKKQHLDLYIKYEEANMSIVYLLKNESKMEGTYKIGEQYKSLAQRNKIQLSTKPLSISSNLKLVSYNNPNVEKTSKKSSVKSEKE